MSCVMLGPLLGFVWLTMGLIGQSLHDVEHSTERSETWELHWVAFGQLFWKGSGERQERPWVR